MVRIRIGLGLDTALVEAPRSACGEMTVGPARLLGWLESQLGLALPEASFTARLVQYLACLKSQAPGRFYEKSFAQDEFAAARTLLQWRDAWYLAGWDGTGFGTGGGHRLHDLAAVEASAAGRVAPGIGERVRRVVAELRRTRLSVDATLLDPAASFPRVWQRLFTALGAIYTGLPSTPSAPPSSDLGKLQRALVSGQAPGGKVRLAGDGTVLVLRDGSPQLSAPWIARFAHASADTDGAVAILAAEHGATLDDALSDAGFARLGFADTSYWRPVFQVLPLTLELLWRPLDPGVLLQFLIHPMAPIRTRLRRPLARIVAEQPGIGGDAWRSALAAALDAAVADEPSAKRPASRRELAEDVDFWLGSDGFDARAGAPVGVLLERARRVCRWLSAAFAAQGDQAEAALYSAALGQAEEFARTLARLGDSGRQSLPRIGVRRLIETVRGAGASRPGRVAQCVAGQAQLLRGDSPAGFTSPLPRVIWWACDRERLPVQYPWSARERAELARHAVELVPLETRLSWQAGTWLRPILAAEQQLAIVLHDNVEGHHPVFDQIVAVAEGWAEARLDELMREPDRVRADRALPAAVSVPLRRLPAKARWWRLPSGVTLPRRARESFSSLEKFLYGPHRWVLEYAARIRPGTLEALDDGPRLKGNLMHALLEQYFMAHTDVANLDPAAATRWVRSRADALIERQGAVLLTPGRQAEKEHFVATAGSALRVLIGHLQQAGVASVAMETELTGRFAGGALAGTLDMIATQPNGKMAVIDIKWGRFDARRQALADGNYLQLAIYAQLLHQNRGQWPALGYFVVSDARLAMLASDFFPGAEVTYPHDGESLLEFWQRAERTWAWRRRQIDAGIVEVPVTGTQPDASSQPGELGLAMPPEFDAYDDYWALTGWGSES